MFELKSDQQIATHLLAKGKGKLTKDPDHGREDAKKQKLDNHISRVLGLFQNEEKAMIFIDQLKVNYPRHIRDQLRVIEAVSERNSDFLEKALNECISLNLFSAVTLRDVANDIARRDVQTDSESTRNNSLSKKYQTITAVERSFESYLQVLGGEQS